MKLKRKPKPHIPQTADELTAAWFTQHLAAQSGGATVTAVEHEVVGEGLGFIGDLYRCRLDWDRDDPSLPASVVAKVPSTVKTNRAIGEALMAYEREIVMYRDHDGQLGLPMPGHIYSEMDPHPARWLVRVVEFLMDHLPLKAVNWLINKLLNLPESTMRRFLLVMEDIDDARPATQFDGGDLEDAHAALRVLAEFHARNWMNADLVETEPLIWSMARSPRVYQASYLRNREQFMAQFSGLLTPAHIAWLDSVHDRVPEMSRQLAEPPWTILHGDYRLDNILFRPNGELVVVDYQLMLWGRAGWDVAYFITTALDAEHRSEEEALLHTYHDAQVDHGISDYSYGDLLSDAKITKELLAHRMVGAGDILDTNIDGRDSTLLDLMVERVIGWADI